MARNLSLSGKAPQIGNNVSHSHRKTKRSWDPNIQTKTLFSAALGRGIRLTIPVCALRSVDRVGGLDNYLLAVNPVELSSAMRRIQDLIRSRTQAD